MLTRKVAPQTDKVNLACDGMRSALGPGELRHKNLSILVSQFASGSRFIE